MSILNWFVPQTNQPRRLAQRLRCALDKSVSSSLLLLLACLMASCAGKGRKLHTEEDPSWISEAQAGAIAQDFLRRNGVTNAELLAVGLGGERWTGVYSASGTNAMLKVFVNRKTQEVGYPDSTR